MNMGEVRSVATEKRTDEQCRELERRSRAGLEWTAFGRRPVTAVVRPFVSMRAELTNAI